MSTSSLPLPLARCESAGAARHAAGRVAAAGWLALLAWGAPLAAAEPPAATAAPAAAPAATPVAASRVRIDTTLGSFIVQLETGRAPLSSANFLAYARSGFYNGTIFHRVINNFVAQAGGYDEKFQAKAVMPSVANESGNGLSNKRGTVGLARSEAPHSGNSQFYVNLTDNEDLDPSPLRWGYAVFGRIVEGMDVVERIGRTPTGSVGPWNKDAPVESVVIRRVDPIPDGAAAPTADTVPPPSK